MAPQLRVTTGPMAGGTIPLTGTLVLGRSEAEPGALGGEPLLSREHARITLTANGDYQLEDLGSTNGTFLNGNRVTAISRLHDGDVIRIGGTTLSFVGRADAQAVEPVRAQAPAPAPAYTLSPPQPSRSRSGPWPAIIAVALIALAAGLGAYIALSGKGSNPGGTPAAAVLVPSDCGASLGGSQPVGFVTYVESNVATQNGNSIILMPYRQTDLAALPPAQCPTGGSGSADLSDSGVLDADNQVLLSPDHSLLFAVNQGSDTIAVFHVDANGALRPVGGSPFSSGGTAPVSLGLAGNILVVANKAQDGIRDLSKVAPTYTTLSVGADGSLTQIANSSIAADPGSSPTDAYVPPGSRVMFSTEESGPLRASSIDPTGLLVQAVNSPLAPDAAIFGSGFNPAKVFGLGIAAHPLAKVLYIGMPTVPALAVYSYDDAATLTYIKSIPVAGAYLPCWIVTTSDGKWAYAANAATNNIVAFAVSDPTTPRQIQTLAFGQPGNPWNEALDPTGKYLFVNTPRDTLGVPEGMGNTQHVMAIGPDGMLSEVAGSPAQIPVAAGVNPQGLGVLTLTH